MPTTAAFAHATGFCGGVWRPVVASLPAGVDSLVWDFPCHGSAPKLQHPIDWWDMATFTLDQVAGAEAPLIGVGHSMGGAVLLMAEIRAPGTFAALLLIEPIVFPPPFGEYEGPQTLLAKKRRKQFSSRDDARANFVEKLPFSAWHPAALDGYVDCGLVETPAGAELSCRPQDEAAFYRAATRHGVWDLLGKVDSPVTILAGESSETHTVDFVQLLASQITTCEYEIVPGTGHFLPMEMPEVVAERLGRIASELLAESTESIDDADAVDGRDSR
ncbi:MAG: alpha/beta fold hydrolase [Acidimicrobiia bacterium]